jgi:hypothetical protein
MPSPYIRRTIPGIPLQKPNLQKLSPEYQTEVCKAYRGGISVIKLAKAHGVSLECIRRTLRRHGVALRGSKISPKSPVLPVSLTVDADLDFWFAKTAMQENTTKAALIRRALRDFHFQYSLDISEVA